MASKEGPPNSRELEGTEVSGLRFIPIPMPPIVEEPDDWILGVEHTPEGEAQFEREMEIIRDGERRARGNLF